MNITVSVAPDKIGAALLRKIASSLDGGVTEPVAVDVAEEVEEAPKPRGRGRPPKAAATAKPEEGEDFDFGDAEGQDDEPAVTLQQVIAACQENAKKHQSKEQALKVLRGFGVKSVQELKPDQFRAVLVALKKS